MKGVCVMSVSKIASSDPSTSVEIIEYAAGPCSLGNVVIAWSAKGLVAVLMDDSVDLLIDDLRHRFPTAELKATDGGQEEVVERVVRHLEDASLRTEIPLDVRGSTFQHRVWAALREIPAGRTATYSEIAAAIGDPSAARAVASACATNPIAVVVPCHRVVRNDGVLSGYAWGIQRKQALLAREAGTRTRLG